MEFSLKSRKLRKILTFTRPGREYIFVDLNGKSGVLGQQICKGGGTMGNTITYSGEDQQQFEKICRRWYRDHIGSLRLFE